MLILDNLDVDSSHYTCPLLSHQVPLMFDLINFLLDSTESTRSGSPKGQLNGWDDTLLTDVFLDDHLDLPCTQEPTGPCTNMKTGQR